MNEIIYLEPDSEITSVIDRIRKADSNSVALVIPRGATLAQSIVNLKLLKKAAEGMDKDISLVSNDRISRNLASQIGLTVFSKVSEADRVRPKINPVPAPKSQDEENEPFKVNNYYRDKEKEEEEIAEPIITPDQEDEGADDVDLYADAPIENDTDDTADSFQGDSEKEIEKDEEDEPKYEKKRVPAAAYKKSNLKSSRKPILIVASVCFVLLLISSFVFLPYASASVQIKTEDYTTDLTILADKAATAIDTSKLTIPSTVVDLEKDQAKDFNSTGTKDAGTKATGSVNIYNATTDKLGLPAGTKLTAGGKVFTLDSAAALPASTVSTDITKCKSLGNGTFDCKIPGSVSDAKVTASATGDGYNIAPTSPFSIGGFSSDKIYAESKTAFSGGATKDLKVVSAADLEKALAALKEEMTTAAKTEVVEKAKKANLTIVEGDIKSEVTSESSTKKADEEATTFNYSIKMKFYVLGFLETDLKKLTDDSVLEKVGNDKMIVNPDSAEITYKVTASDLDVGTINLKTSFKGKIGQKLDANQIKTSIKNKSVSNAKTAITSNDNVENVEITVWPSFYKRIPLLKNRIKVTFDYAK